MRYETVLIAKITIGHRFRKDLGDIPSLMASIKLRGQLAPILVDTDYNLIAGQRRLTAIRELGRKEIEVKVIDLSDLDPLAIEHDENEIRKDFTISERVAIGKALEEKFQGQVVGRSETAAAVSAGFGNRETFRQAVSVVEDAAPEVVEAMDNGTISIYDASRIVAEPANIQRAVVNDVIEGKANTVAEALRERNSQRDRAGQLWPRHIIPAIEASHDLNDFRITVLKLVDRAKSFLNGPLNVHIEWSPIIDSLEKARKACLYGKPDYKCPYCGATGKANERTTCKLCKGSGWVPERIWEQAGQD